MLCGLLVFLLFFFSSRRRHTRWPRDWSSDVCSSDLTATVNDPQRMAKFVSFINAPGVADPELAWVPERGQMRPAGEMDTHTAPDPVRARELAMISHGATRPMGDSVEGEETRACARRHD